MTPLFSVVIPSYNHAAYIADAVQSVLSQSVTDLELIVIDDGSRDSSLEVLNGMSDPRLQVIAQQNQGAHLAIDRGLQLSKGRYVTILNSDDCFLPDRLALALEAFREQPDLALVGSYIEVVDAEGKPIAVKQGYHNLDPWPVPAPEVTFKPDADLRTALLMQNYWSTTSNFIMPRAIYEIYGPFQPLRYVHDWDFALRVLRTQPAKLLERPLLQYRVHTSNTIRTNRPAMVYEICWALAQHLPLYMQEPWFWEKDEARRLEQLTNSVFVYGCESVFWKMMSLIAFGVPNVALRLLDDESPLRQQLLAEIQSILQAQETDTTSLQTAPVSQQTDSWLRKFFLRRGL